MGELLHPFLAVKEDTPDTDFAHGPPAVLQIGGRSFPVYGFFMGVHHSRRNLQKDGPQVVEVNVNARHQHEGMLILFEIIAAPVGEQPVVVVVERQHQNAVGPRFGAKEAYILGQAHRHVVQTGSYPEGGVVPVYIKGGLSPGMHSAKTG